MSDEAKRDEAAADNDTLPWCLATPQDVEGLDFEAPIKGSNSAHARPMARLFEQAYEGHSDPQTTPSGRVFLMLAAISGLYFKPDDREEPYGAMYTSGDGRRTAIVQDFRGTAAATVCLLAERSQNLTLKARLSDVSWLLDKRRHDLGVLAITSYSSVVTGVAEGRLTFLLQKDKGPLCRGVRDTLLRALTMARRIGWDKDSSNISKSWVRRLREEAVLTGTMVQLRWFSELDLKFGLSDPATIATDIEKVISRTTLENNYDDADLWRLAARAYRSAKLDSEASRCQAEGAECLVRQSRAGHSAMSAAHWLSSAIAELHGLPGQRQRRTELLHELLDIQGRIPDELSSFSHDLDLEEMTKRVTDSMRGQSLSAKLKLFATLTHSPNVSDLRKDAEESIREHPLSAMLGASHLDESGKVIHRTEGGEGEGAIAHYISQHEGIRRHVDAYGAIDVARQIVSAEHYLSDDVFQSLLRHSPFVAPSQILTYSRGFTRFFQGDLVSGLYILTPLLESSLRHVLRSTGHEVTIFDDADQLQQDRTISSIFDQMRTQMTAVFGQNLTADIEHVFLKKPGPCVRHDVAHGLTNDGTPYGPDAIYACWLIFRLCCIPMLRHWQDAWVENVQAG